MPELPEVETVRRGVSPHLIGQTINAVIVRDGRLRWPVLKQLPERLAGRTIVAVRRRAKYLLVELDRGHLMIHLGMSGRLYFVPPDSPAGIHDHVDWQLSNRQVLRYTDPRRFGAVIWVDDQLDRHPLLAKLGPEPLSEDFDGDYLYQRARGRKVPVKSLLMDGQVVVGVGNIYANEALFMAGIRPDRAAGRISLARYQALAAAAKAVLQKAIDQGGTTLRDFVGGDGKPGYFKQELQVYGKAGKACPLCAAPLREIRLAQRSTVYCPQCQR